MNADTILLIVAAICFGLATFNVTVKSLNLVALGLFAWVVSLLI